MPIVLDTSVFYALRNPDDSNHANARDIMVRVVEGRHGTPVTSDYVLDETLTLLQKRSRDPTACRELAGMLGALPDAKRKPLIQLMTPTEPDRTAATRLFFERFDRKLSFTDCILIQLARNLNAPIASFDAGFDGLVERVSE